jgi:tetratricopeptide (TPR) repeat protein
MNSRRVLASIFTASLLFASNDAAVVHAWEGGPKPPSAAKRGVVLTTEQLFKQVSPSVVRIVVRDRKLKPIGHGSGFFVSEDGLVITNFHVIEGAFLAQVTTSDGTVYSLKGVEAFDKDADLAILRVSGKDLPALKLASGEPPVGSKVFAIGNPHGFTNSLSDGIVSGHRRLPDGTVFLQTTAAISRGSSGGPLLATDGRVVAVTTASVRGAQNLNLAVPVSMVSKLLSQRKGLTSLTTIGVNTLSKLETKLLRDVWRAIDGEDSTRALRNLAKLRPTLGDSVGYWMACGQVHLQLNNNDIAVNAFERASKLDPDDWKPLLSLSEAHAVNGDTDKALAAAHGAVLLAPDKAIVYEELASCFLKSNQLVKAKNAVETAIQLKPHASSGHFLLGTILSALGSYEGAEVALKRSLQEFQKERAIDADQGKLSRIRYPTSYRIQRTYPNRSVVRFHVALANLYRRSGERGNEFFHAGLIFANNRSHAKAEEYLKKAILLPPYTAAAHFELGRTLRFSSPWSITTKFTPTDPTYRRIAAHFKRAIEFDSRHADAHAAWAELAESFWDHDVAIAHGKAAMRIRPCASHSVTLAHAYLRADRKDDAIEELQRSTAVYPSMDGLLLFGELLSAKDKTQATGAYKQAVSLNPSDIRPWRRWLAMLPPLQDREAERLCNKAIATVKPVVISVRHGGPRPARTLRIWQFYASLKGIYSRRQDLEAFVGLANHILSLDTVDSEKVWIDLGEAYHSTRRFSEAIQCYRNGLKAIEKNGKIAGIDRRFRFSRKKGIYLTLFRLHLAAKDDTSANAVMHEGLVELGEDVNRRKGPHDSQLVYALDQHVHTLTQRGEFGNAQPFLATLVECCPSYVVSLPNADDDGLIACLEGVDVRRISVGGRGGSQRVTERGIRFLSSCRSLEELTIRLRFKSNEKGEVGRGDRIIQLVSKLPHLRTFRLHSAYSREEVTKDGITSLAGAGRLQELDLSGTVLNEPAASAIASIESLRKVCLSGDEITDAVVKSLTKLTELRSLELRATSITDDGLALVPDFKELEVLRVTTCDISSKGVEPLRSLQSLRELDISGTKVTDSILETIRELTSLKTLDVSRTDVTLRGLLKMYRSHSSDDLDATEAALRAAGGYGIRSRQITDVPVADFQNIKFGVARLDKSTVQELLGANPKLKGVCISGGGDVKDEWLVHLKGLTELHNLGLHDTKITDAGLVHLKGLATLESLDLRGTQITDAGLAHLKNLTNLSHLYLQHTQVTDAGLVHLKGLANLQHLRLLGTKVTDTGVADLQKSLPNCGISK